MAAKPLICLLIAVTVCSVRCWDFSDHGSIHVLDADFEEKVSDGSVYFIKFFAPWCGHCKRMGATWKDLAEEFRGHETIKIAHVDCTKDRSVCNTAGVSGYPTLKIFYKGEAVKKYHGNRQLDDLRKFVEQAASDLLEETAAAAA